MDAVALTIGVSWLLSGLLCIGLSIPLIVGRIGPNAYYGIRFPESFESDEAWFAINRFGGKRLALWSVPLVVIGVVTLFLPLRSNVILTVVLSVAPLVFIFIPLFQAWVFARRYPSHR